MDFRKKYMVHARISEQCNKLCMYVNMTKILMHTVANSTKTSFRPKTNNQPLKKFFVLCSVEQKLSKIGRHFRKYVEWFKN